MTDGVRRGVSSVVGTEPWRNVGADFPGTEPLVVEAAKVARATATGMPFQTSATSSDQAGAVVITRSLAK